LRKPGGRTGVPRAAPRNPVVCGRKFCAGCGRWRHVVDFPTSRGQLRGCCWTCSRIRDRAYYANRTAAQRELRNEYLRIWQDARRRAAGKREFGRRRRTAVDGVERVLLPAEPLLPLLFEVSDFNDLARRSGVSSRRIWGLRQGESAHVRIDVADKLAVALGVPSAVIWEEW